MVENRSGEIYHLLKDKQWQKKGQIKKEAGSQTFLLYGVMTSASPISVVIRME
jgi:hypothetical protein